MACLSLACPGRTALNAVARTRYPPVARVHSLAVARPWTPSPRALPLLLVRLYETPSSPPKPPLPGAAKQPNFIEDSEPPSPSTPQPPPPPPPPSSGTEPPPKDAPLFRRLAHAWTSTPTRWYPLPLTVGALLLVALAWKKQLSAGDRAESGADVVMADDGEVLRLQGPWQVHVLGALPLRQLSRAWGWFNALPLPVWFRPYGYGLYAWVFGCNLAEIDPPDLRAYGSMGEFFYRRLRDGAREIAGTSLVSPADGTLVHFGTIENRRVEQVKGITYSLDSLLGRSGGRGAAPVLAPALPQREAVQDEEFANVNGIEYSLEDLMGRSSGSSSSPISDAKSSSSPPLAQHAGDKSVAQPLGDALQQTAAVAHELGVQAVTGLGETLKPGNRLYYCVVYLAPGDYHRFHSPASWVVQKRRHFSGELFSVNPWLVSRLPNLFVLNERVALLGKWTHGFFAFVPVGATNVGSIRIAFDSDLRTNSDSPSDSAGARRPPIGTYVEASYATASRVLGGQPLVKGAEMGGFALGSTIVVVFEAPAGWRWLVGAGEKVRVGQALGEVEGKVAS